MTTTESSLAVDARRFWSTVMRSGEIGPGKAGGLRRLALTDADKEMRDLFVTWCTEVGCTVTIDRVGNIFARRPGTDDHLPPVLMGSHLDTQVAGGKYDGIVGVLAGLEVLRTLDAARMATKRPLELVCWTKTVQRPVVIPDASITAWTLRDRSTKPRPPVATSSVS